MEQVEGSRASDGRPLPVVLGYDGSRSARHALGWAAAEAERLGARVIVVYAADYPGMSTQLPGEGLLTREPGALAAAAEVADEGVAAILDAHPRLTVSAQTDVRAAPHALADAAADAALLVIGTRGLPRVVSAIVGSVAYAVSGRSEVPVVVVKDDTEALRTEPGRPIVVGADGSVTADGAVAFAVARAAATGAPLRVVCATNEDFTATIPEERLRRERAEVAERAAADLAATFPSVPAEVEQVDGTADRALIDASASAALVVVGSHGRGATRGLVLGSVSQAVIRGARCPVAVIGPAAAPGRRPAHPPAPGPMPG